MKIKIIALISLVLLATLAAQEPDPLWALSDVITLGDGEQIQGLSTNGTFEPVTLEPLATIDVKLQFSTSLAGAPVIVETLDGGSLSGVGESATSMGTEPCRSNSMCPISPDSTGLRRRPTEARLGWCNSKRPIRQNRRIVS